MVGVKVNVAVAVAVWVGVLVGIFVAVGVGYAVGGAGVNEAWGVAVMIMVLTMGVRVVCARAVSPTHKTIIPSK
jgi:hypothetical protein